MPISRIPFPVLANVNNLILLVSIFINFLTKFEANHATLCCIESLSSEFAVACNHPTVRMTKAIAVASGEHHEARLDALDEGITRTVMPSWCGASNT
jgi:hypothetical protein